MLHSSIGTPCSSISIARFLRNFVQSLDKRVVEMFEGHSYIVIFMHPHHQGMHVAIDNLLLFFMCAPCIRYFLQYNGSNPHRQGQSGGCWKRGLHTLQNRLFPGAGVDADEGCVGGAVPQVAQVLLGWLDEGLRTEEGPGMHPAGDFQDENFRKEGRVQVRE